MPPAASNQQPARPRARRRLPRRHRSRPDAGSAAITIAIIFPAIGLIFLAITQVVLVAVAHHTALAAAEEGLRVARAHHATLAAGRAAALGFAHHEPVLEQPAVTATGTTTITVTVCGKASTVFPGLGWQVSGTVHGVREHYTLPIPAEDRP